MTLGPLMVDVAGTALTAEDRRVLAHPLVGSVILFTRNFESAVQLESLVRTSTRRRGDGSRGSAAGCSPPNCARSAST